MIVLPSLVSEYSTVMAFDSVTRLAIKTADFEIAESSGQHALRHASELAAQLPMAIRPVS
jgi:hypothetical protein